MRERIFSGLLSILAHPTPRHKVNAPGCPLILAVDILLSLDVDDLGVPIDEPLESIFFDQIF